MTLCHSLPEQRGWVNMIISVQTFEKMHSNILMGICSQSFFWQWNWYPATPAYPTSWVSPQTTDHQPETSTLNTIIHINTYIYIYIYIYIYEHVTLSIYLAFTLSLSLYIYIYIYIYILTCYSIYFTHFFLSLSFYVYIYE